MTKTVFCDIDGTILKHHGNIFDNILKPPIMLNNVLDKFREWDKANYKIILTTGRKESYRSQTESQLNAMGIPYDQMIMGLPNGERVLINDKKQDGIDNTARAINLVRNKGLEHVNLETHLSDTQIILKPWGYEKIVEHNNNYVVKELFMKKGHSCSLQYHELKKETIYVLKGKLNIYIGDTVEKLECKEYQEGDHITISPYTIHRMEGVEDSVYLETSTNELWDVVRLQDKYGRT